MRMDDEVESKPRLALVAGAIAIALSALSVIFLGVKPAALPQELRTGLRPDAASLNPDAPPHVASPNHDAGPRTSSLNPGAGPDADPPKLAVPPAAEGSLDADMKRFVTAVFRSTGTTWTALFVQSHRPYVEPGLVLFSGAVKSACGFARETVGPFYCATERRVYIDLSFYRDLKTRFHSPGDFAEAYVVAHEVGHHVQGRLGILARARRALRSASAEQRDALSVRLELQADCFAGVWAYHANRQGHVLEPGDIVQGLSAATRIGEDRQQMRERGYLTPESFTHGTAAQRARWFQTGLETGELRRCDTFRPGEN